MSRMPFFGVSQHPDGTYTDILTGETITVEQIKVQNMTPFYGRFLDKDGVEHDIREIGGGGGGDGGAFPSGGIIMWSGAIDAVPAGWVLCDGTNNTPDLRNRFVVGAGGTYGVGNVGGSDSIILTTEQLAGHNHNISIVRYAENQTTYFTGLASQDLSWATAKSWAHPPGMTTVSGSGSPHENRPPYFALAYIMKI